MNFGKLKTIVALMGLTGIAWGINFGAEVSANQATEKKNPTSASASGVSNAGASESALNPSRSEGSGQTPAEAGQTIVIPEGEQPLGLVLATKNDALFRGKPEEFFQVVERYFDGKVFYPWEGGQYGFVRNPLKRGDGLIYSKFHEGLDIRPVDRDARQEPLDKVMAIADGEVVYVTSRSGQSAYGHYVVVKHDWGSGPFYSLYAHLKSISTKVGTIVKAGDILGDLGYTGTGINRARAHVHLELNMILSHDFAKWYSSNIKSPNVHGNYNGLNLVGIDLTSLYLSHQKNPNLSLAAFVQSSEPYFRVRVPWTGQPELLANYPWLLDPESTLENPKSWEIAFSASGVPIRVYHRPYECKTMTLCAVREHQVDHSIYTRGRLTGTGLDARLTSSGLSYLKLVTGNLKVGVDKIGQSKVRIPAEAR